MIIGEGTLIYSDYITITGSGFLHEQGISWEQPGPDFLKSCISR